MQQYIIRVVIPILFIIPLIIYVGKNEQSVIDSYPFIEPLQIDASIKDNRLNIIWESSSDSVSKYEAYAYPVVYDSTGWRKVGSVFLGSIRIDTSYSGENGHEMRSIIAPGNYRIGIKRTYTKGTTHISTSEVIGMGTSANLSIDQGITNGKLNISVTLPEPAHTKLTLFNVLGQDIATISDSTMHGLNLIPIDLSPFPAGVYFILMQSGNDHLTVKIHYVK